MLNPDVARGTLLVLAGLQARNDEPWRDAEPGKILHELRVGRARADRADPAHALLRNRRRDAAVPDGRAAATTAGRVDLETMRAAAPGARRRARTGSTTAATATATASSSTSSALAGGAAQPRLEGLRTTRSCTPTARSPRARSRSSRSRATSTRPSCESPMSTRRSGTRQRAASCEPRPPRCARHSTRPSGTPRRARSRSRSTGASAQVRSVTSNPGALPVLRDRR